MNEEQLTKHLLQEQYPGYSRSNTERIDIYRDDEELCQSEILIGK